MQKYLRTSTAVAARRGLALAALLVLPAGVASADSLRTIGQAQVSFQATGPAGLEIDGKSSQLSGREEGKQLVFTAPLGDLKTGIELRDKHLRGYLETSKYPNAKLVVDLGKLEHPEENQKVSAKRSAAFTLHGVTKPVAVSYEAKRTGSDIHVTAQTELDIRDFEVEVPCYLGVCVRPTVQVKVKFKLRGK